MKILHLAHDRQCVQVTAEHGEVRVSSGYAGNPTISGTIVLTPCEAERLVEAINAAVDALGEVPT